MSDRATDLLTTLTPNLGNELHWNNSSNVLCNYMKKQEYLDLVLRNQAIIPRYVMEPIGYLNLGELKKICFPISVMRIVGFWNWFLTGIKAMNVWIIPTCRTISL